MIESIQEIVNKDCIVGLKTEPNDKFDLIITDPPYGISHKKKIKVNNRKKDVSFDFGEWDYFKDEETYLKWCREWITECSRVLKDDGHIFIWQDKTLPLKSILEESGFEIRNIIVWSKTNPVPSFQKVNFLSSMEFAIWATKKGSKRKNQTFNFTKQTEMHNIQMDKLEEMTKEDLIETISKILNKSLIEDNKNEITINEEGVPIHYRSSIVMGKERTSHPCQKPESFTKKLIELFTNEGDFVLDIFGGSGTVSKVCKDINRNCKLYELDEKWFKISKERLNN